MSRDAFRQQYGRCNKGDGTCAPVHALAEHHDLCLCRLDELREVLIAQLQAASSGAGSPGTDQHAQRHADAMAAGLPELQNMCAQQEVALQRAAMEAHGLAAELQCAREEVLTLIVPDDQALLSAIAGGEPEVNLRGCKLASALHRPSRLTVGPKQG